jgi:O-antigen ligase
MVTSSLFSPHPVPDLNGQHEQERMWPWVAFLFFMLFIFSISTPFMFYWPMEELLGQHFKGGLATGIAHLQAGNPKRRVGMVVLFITSLIILGRTKNRLQLSGMLGFVLIFYWCWIMLSMTWSIDPAYTIRRLAVVFIVWFSAFAMASRFTLRQLAILAVFITGCTLLIGVANELRLHTFDLTREKWRFSGVLHCVSMGWNCGILALSTIFLLTGEKKKRYQILLWTILTTAIIFLLLTKTRTAVGAAIVSIGFYWFKVVSAPRKVFMVLGVIIILSASYVTLGNRLFYYGEEASTLGRGEAAKSSVSSLTGRLPLWTYCFKFAAERPLHGYGFSSFINANTIEDIFLNVGWAPGSIHSGYVNELMGTGVVGMGALIAMLFLALKRALALAKKNPAYLYPASAIIWLCFNLFLETTLIIGTSFMAFWGMMLLTKLAFMPVEELKQQ